MIYISLFMISACALVLFFLNMELRKKIKELDDINKYHLSFILDVETSVIAKSYVEDRIETQESGCFAVFRNGINRKVDVIRLYYFSQEEREYQKIIAEEISEKINESK